jgi:hypothetical protein
MTRSYAELTDPATSPLDRTRDELVRGIAHVRRALPRLVPRVDAADLEMFLCALSDYLAEEQRRDNQRALERMRRTAGGVPTGGL